MSVAGLFVLSFILGALGAQLVSRFAGRMGLLDCPNERSSHTNPTPRGGGVGIFVVFLFSAAATDSSLTFWLPISAVAILAFCGDWIDLSPKLRLCAQLFLMVLLVVGSDHFPSNPLWYLPWVLFWTVFIVGTANFYNFMDGIDGIAGITGIIGFGLLAYYIFTNDGQTTLCTVAVCTSLACLGFLPLNMPRARVFMGDIGSILLGATFGSLIFLSSKTFLDFLCMASFLFPFYADELATMFVRLRDGESLTEPHRRHIYQLLSNEKGISHWKISVGYGFIQLVVGESAMLLKSYGIPVVLALLIFFFIAFSFVSVYLRSSLKRSFGPDPHRRTRKVLECGQVNK